MAHFDRDGIIDPHLRATLADLAASGAQTVLVSTNLAEGEEARELAMDQVIRRENRGYDFRSWQVGLQALGGLGSIDEVVVINDSFYLAREGALSSAMAAAATRRWDVWALTASHELGFHLQSYFLAFRRPAFQSSWFRQFWDAVSPDGQRADAIVRYELPMAVQARAAGLSVGALLTGSSLPAPGYVSARGWAHFRAAGPRAAGRGVLEALRSSADTNPTLRQWRATSRTCGVVKVELLRDNPRGADLADIGRRMEPACLARARAHLARTAPAAAARVFR